MSIPFKQEQEVRYGEAIEMSPLVRRLFAKNPSPYTYTGTGSFLVGRKAVAVIDPGPGSLAHLDNILAAVAPGKVTHIFVTHTHVDHSPAAALLKARTGATVYGFGPHGGEKPLDDAGNEVEAESEVEAEVQVEEGADLDFEPDVRLQDGQSIMSGEWTIETLHTPGHTSNHLCFVLQQEKCVFTGDHVMGWATSVISPPDGNMAHYMESLAKLKTRDDRLYRPTHGPAIENPQAFVAELMDHRRAREALIMDAVQAGLTSLSDITARAYSSVPKGLHRAAARSALAHLIFLREKGKITQRGCGPRAHFAPLV